MSDKQELITKDLYALEYSFQQKVWNISPLDQIIKQNAESYIEYEGNCWMTVFIAPTIDECHRFAQRVRKARLKRIGMTQVITGLEEDGRAWAKALDADGNVILEIQRFEGSEDMAVEQLYKDVDSLSDD